MKDLIISAHGLLPILEILEPCTVKSRQPVILQLLKIVNAVRAGVLPLSTPSPRVLADEIDRLSWMT